MHELLEEESCGDGEPERVLNRCLQTRLPLVVQAIRELA